MSEETNNGQQPGAPEAPQSDPIPAPTDAPISFDPPAPAQPQQPATEPVQPQQPTEPVQPQQPVTEPVPPQQPVTEPVQPQQPVTEQMPYDPNQVQYGQPVQAPSTDPYAAQPAQPYYEQAGAPVATGAGSGKAMGALICGILAILFSELVLPGLILGIIAVVLASQYVKSFGKEGKATGGKVTGFIGIAFSVIWLIIYIFAGAILMTAINQYDSRYSSEYTYSYGDSTYEERNSTDSSDSSSSSETSDEAAIKELTLDALKEAKELDQDEFDALAAEYDAIFTETLTISMADAGIDPAKVVQANLDSITYDFDSVYVKSDGTATAFADVESAEIWGFLNTLYENLDKDIKLDKDSPEDLAFIGTEFMKAVEETEPSDYYAMFEFTKSGDTWTIDPDSFDEKMKYVYGTY